MLEPAEDNAFRGTESGSFNSLKGPASLLPSSQADTWGTTKNTPWNQSTSTSPALATIRPTPTTTGSNSSGRQIEPTSQSNDSLRSTSPYLPNRQLVGQPIGNSGQGSRKSATLDPTSGSFIAGWSSESNKATGFGAPTEWSQPFRSSDTERESLSGRSFDDDQDRIGRSSQDDFAGSQRLGTSSSAASRSGSIPPQRNITSSSSGQYGMHLGSSLGQQPFPQTSNPLGGARSFHSPRNSAYSSHSQAPRSDISDTEARSLQMAAALGSMYIDGNGTANPFGTNTRSQTSQSHQTRQLSSMNQARHNLPQYGNGFGSFAPEGYPESNVRDYLSIQRRAEGLGSISPSASDQVHGIQGPFYSSGGTPPAIGDELRAPSRGSSSSRYQQNHSTIPQPHVVLLERKLRGVQQEQQNPQPFFYPQPNPLYLRADAYRGGYPPNMYDFNPQSALRLGQYAPYLPMQPVRTPAAGPAPPRGPARDQDSAHNLVSSLMQEFRSNSKTSKRYELKVWLSPDNAKTLN
jgi:mRNA-binding protein PUF3